MHRDDTALSKTQSPQRVAEKRRDRVMQINSVMRVSSHRFQTQVTISVPLRCSARPQRSLRFHGPRSLRARQLRDRGADRPLFVAANGCAAQRSSFGTLNMAWLRNYPPRQ
jgi:hypothetical protein